MKSTPINKAKLRTGNTLQQKALEAIEQNNPDILIKAIETFFNLKKGLHKTTIAYIKESLEWDTLASPFNGFKGISSALSLLLKYEDLFGDITLKNCASDYFPGLLFATLPSGLEFYLMLESGAVWYKHHDELIEWADLEVNYNKNQTEKKLFKRMGLSWRKRIDLYLNLQTTLHQSSIKDFSQIKPEQVKDFVEAIRVVYIPQTKKRDNYQYNTTKGLIEHMQNNNWFTLTEPALKVFKQVIQYGYQIDATHRNIMRIKWDDFNIFSKAS
ncbi:MAG: hypothetical protein GY810_31155 [Aureispira sp.]|nr:hypothetical protein [Aureispira sp.]